MKRYVIGFAFDKFGSCALIEKQRPDWQKGKWNGIGGKIKEGETLHEAMVREFLEETGMATTVDMWRLAGGMGSPGEFDCRVFTTVVDTLTVTTLTDEKVRVFTKDMLNLLGIGYSCLNNIPAILALLRTRSDSRGIIPTFYLDYSEPST